MHTIRRLLAADRWPWTWSALIVACGAIQPWRWIALLQVAAGLAAVATAIEIVDRRTRDRLQIMAASCLAAGIITIIGWSWDLLSVVAAVAVIAWQVGDRTPGMARLTADKVDRRAQRKAHRDARHAAAEAAEAWQ